MYLLLPFLCVMVAAAHPNDLGVNPEELHSTLIANQLLLSQQTELLKEMVNAAQRNKGNCPEGASCPHPYTQVLDECFYLSPHKLTWEKARQHCQGMMGDLASPKHPYALKSFILNLLGTGDIVVFLGGQDENKNRHFKWLDGRVIANNYWYPGEPNNSGGSEFCVNLMNSLHPLLNDVSCTADHLFACQYYRPKAN
ncbi:C-type lectin-like [Cherax quadricarinatus]|uniref:C-type lectin-like n=1 Tax=Cherax quadricarinatus TaxID=27406 RepID=UPI00387E8DA9